jgi:hypothetical protein
MRSLIFLSSTKSFLIFKCHIKQIPIFYRKKVFSCSSGSEGTLSNHLKMNKKFRRDRRTWLSSSIQNQQDIAKVTIKKLSRLPMITRETNFQNAHLPCSTMFNSSFMGGRILTSTKTLTLAHYSVNMFSLFKGSLSKLPKYSWGQYPKYMSLGRHLFRSTWSA